MAYTYGATTYAKLYGVSSTYNAYQVRVGYELQSQSVENNSSTYKAILQARTVKDAYETYGYKQTTTLAGTALSAATFSVQTVNTWVTFGTRTITVTHDDYGDYKETITGSFTTTGNETYALLSGSATVEVSLPNIPRKTTPTLSKSSVTLGETITITLPRAADSFTHELYYKVGTSAKILIAADLGASYSYTVPLMFANWIENSTSGTVIIYCQTYSGDTYIGETSVNLTVAIPSDIVPIISNFTVTEAVSDVSSKVGVYLKGKSKLSISFEATGNYAATITATKITVGTQSYTGTSVTTSVLSVTGTLRITVEATDTRGRKNSSYKDITVYDYAKPYINVFSVARCDANGNLTDSGTYAKATIDAGVTNVSNNTATYKVGYKLPTASSYTYTTLSNTTLSLDSSIKLSPTFDATQTYDMILVVTDVFNTSTNRKTVLETEFVLMEFHSSGTGLALGKVAESSNLFDVNLPTEFRKGAKGVKILDGKSTTRFTSANFEATSDRVNSLEYLVATQEMTEGKPPWDAHILHMNWDNTNGYDAQLAVGHGTNLGVAIRGMEKGAWGNWVVLYSRNDTTFYGNAETATKATKDGAGNTITTTYAKIPVGTVLVTSTNTAPVSYGTWELIDKEFKPQIVNPATFTINTTNCTSCAVLAVLAGHSINLRFSPVNKVAIADTQLTFGTLDLSSIGITALPYQLGSFVGGADGGNVWSLWQLTTNGVLSSVDCDAASSSVPAGNTTSVYHTYVIKDITTMLDSFCDRYYWKRTA